jgi:putative addiction module CopG family antidote
MEIHLSPELEAKVEVAVESGRFASVDEYIAAAVSRLEERQSYQYETGEQLNAMLQEGLDDVEAENLISMDQLKEDMEKMKAEWAGNRQPA